MEITEKLERAREMYLRENISLKKIAKQLGISHHLISDTSVAEGWVKQKCPPGPLQDPAQYQRIRDRYIHGEMTLRDLASDENIPFLVLRNCSAANHWSADRDAYREQHHLPPLRKRQLSPEDLEKIAAVRRDYIAGLGTLQELAKKHGISMQPVQRASSLEDWPLQASRTPSSGPKPARAYPDRTRDWPAIEADYISSQQSPEEIAAKYGMTPMLLRHYIIRYDWDLKRLNYRDDLRSQLHEHVENGTPPPDAHPVTPDPESFLKDMPVSDYDDIRLDFITGHARISELASKYDINLNTLISTYQREHWARRRREYRRRRVENLLEARRSAEIASQIQLRRVFNASLEGMEESVAEMRTRTPSPDEWKTAMEALDIADAIDRRTAGLLTPMEAHKQDMDRQSAALRIQQRDDDYEIALEKLDLERESLTAAVKDRRERSDWLKTVREQELDLRRRKVDLLERIESEKNAPPKPIPIYWGDPRMEDCAK